MTLSPQQQQILDYVTQFQMVSIKELQTHFGSRGAVTSAYKMQAKGYLSIEDGHIMLAGKSTEDLDQSSEKILHFPGEPGFPKSGWVEDRFTSIDGRVTHKGRTVIDEPTLMPFRYYKMPEVKMLEDKQKTWLLPASIIALALSITLLSLTLIQL